MAEKKSTAKSAAKKYRDPEVQDMPEIIETPKKSKKTPDENAIAISKIIGEIEPIAAEETLQKAKKPVKKSTPKTKTTPKAVKKPANSQKKISITNSVSEEKSEKKTPEVNNPSSETLDLSSVAADTSSSLVVKPELNPDTDKILASATENLDTQEEDDTEEIPVNIPQPEPIREVADNTMVNPRRRRTIIQETIIEEEPEMSSAEISDILDDFYPDESEVEEIPAIPETTKSTKKPKKTPKKARKFRIFSRILAIITTLALIGIFVTVGITGIVPIKYFAVAAGVAGLFALLYLILAFRKKTAIWLLVILDLLGFITSTGSIFAYFKLDETMRFLRDNLNQSKVVSIYDVIVAKKSTYESLNDVKGKTFYSVSAFTDTEKLEKAAKEQADATVKYDDDIVTLLDSTAEDLTKIALVNDGTYEGILDANKDYGDKLKIIGTIEVEVDERSKNNANLTEEPFIIYISGIDTRSGSMPERSLSDVNILLAINPKAKRILMISIPRDYYVQLHGTTGLKDKLTHAGSLGGIDLSMSTIEDLMEIEISQYLRVNFNAVVGLIDAIGGVNVYSDVDYSFSCLTNKSCVFYPGDNPVGGDCALAFARERYAYESGDRHRGENQEQIISLVINKMTSSTTLISKYSSILNSLSGHFESSLSTEDITKLVNMQLNDMATWEIDTSNLDGKTGMDYTYSFSGQPLSVMYPDESTIEKAKTKLAEIMNGNN